MTPCDSVDWRGSEAYKTEYKSATKTRDEKQAALFVVSPREASIFTKSDQSCEFGPKNSGDIRTYIYIEHASVLYSYNGANWAASQLIWWILKYPMICKVRVYILIVLVTQIFRDYQATQRYQAELQDFVDGSLATFQELKLRCKKRKVRKNHWVDVREAEASDFWIQHYIDIFYRLKHVGLIDCLGDMFTVLVCKIKSKGHPKKVMLKLTTVWTMASNNFTPQMLVWSAFLLTWSSLRLVEN